MRPETYDRVRAAWSKRLAVDPDAFDRPGRTDVVRDSLDAAVVVQPGQSVVVLSPPTVVGALERLGTDLVTDLDAVTAALEGHVVRSLGSAILAYADEPPVSERSCGRTCASPARTGRRERSLRHGGAVCRPWL